MVNKLSTKSGELSHSHIWHCVRPWVSILNFLHLL